MTNKTTRTGYMQAACAGILMLGATAQGATTKEQELEARISQLEQLVKELSTRSAQSPAATTQIAAPATTSAPAGSVQTKSIVPNAVGGTRFMYSGYVKLDTMWSKYRDGEIADGSVGRDFYLPSTIPVGAADEGVDLDAHIKQSRFIFGTDTDLPDNGSLSSRLEIDLYGSSLGDERATNTYGLLVRQAYLQYNKWLFGQTWSNFQDVGALPETADYIGPTDGTVFVRQAMVKYTTGNLSFSAENPETTLTPFGGGTRISSDDNSIPDLTAAYNFKFAQGYVRAAVLGRQLKYQTTGAGATNDSAYAGAVSVAGKINFGADDLRFMATAGNSLGRYVGVNFANDAVLDAQGNIKAIKGWAAFAAWKHAWNKQLRSTFMVSASAYDNDVALTGTAVNKSSQSFAVNLFYTPTPKLDLGVELRHAKREIESGVDGSMDRLQGVAKYSF